MAIWIMGIRDFGTLNQMINFTLSYNSELCRKTFGSPQYMRM